MFNVIIQFLTSGFSSFLNSTLSLVAKHWKVFLALFVMSCLGYYIWTLNAKVNELQERNFELAHDHALLIERCKVNKSTLEEAIKKQNAVIMELNIDLKKKALQIDEIVKQNEDLKKQYYEDLITLFQEELPETCEESIRYLINGKDDLQW